MARARAWMSISRRSSDAAVRIRGHVRRTPLLATDLAPGLMVKPESLQITGSFKARGAFDAGAQPS